MSRWAMGKVVMPAVPVCSTCGADRAPLGLGPPAVERQAWYCGRCWPMLPTTQASLARRVREALEDEK